MQETSRVSQLVEGEGKWRAKQELNGRHSLLFATVYRVAEE